jgi:hypothetical protein
MNHHEYGDGNGRILPSRMSDAESVCSDVSFRSYASRMSMADRFSSLRSAMGSRLAGLIHGGTNQERTGSSGTFHPASKTVVLPVQPLVFHGVTFVTTEQLNATLATLQQCTGRKQQAVKRPSIAMNPLESWDEKYQLAIRKRNLNGYDVLASNLEVAKLIGEYREIVRFFGSKLIDDHHCTHDQLPSQYGDIVFAFAADYANEGIDWLIDD